MLYPLSYEGDEGHEGGGMLQTRCQGGDKPSPTSPRGLKVVGIACGDLADRRSDAESNGFRCSVVGMDDADQASTATPLRPVPDSSAPVMLPVGADQLHINPNPCGLACRADSPAAVELPECRALEARSSPSSPESRVACASTARRGAGNRSSGRLWGARGRLKIHSQGERCCTQSCR
jgi:hypothetical protein